MAAWDLGAAVRTARARRGWSREALAFHAGVSWSAIAQIETGRRKDPHTSSLLALATALDVSVDYLIGTAGTSPQLFEHRVLMYGSDEAFTAGAVPFLLEGAEQSQCLLAVASKAKIALLREGLGHRARLVEFADWGDWYSSPATALRRYREFVTQECERGGNWVRVVAEAGWANETGPALAAWNRYEALVNLAFAPWPATILCTYDEQAFTQESLSQARRTHPTLAHGGGVVVNELYREPTDLLLLEAET